jgi:hypothetical protein
MKKDKTPATLAKALKEYHRRQKILSSKDAEVWQFFPHKAYNPKVGYWVNGQYWLAPWEYRECCWKIQDFSDRNVLLKHARSVQHVAKLYNIFQSHLQKRIIAEKVFRVIVSKNARKR